MTRPKKNSATFISVVKLLIVIVIGVLLLIQCGGDGDRDGWEDPPPGEPPIVAGTEGFGIILSVFLIVSVCTAVGLSNLFSSNKRQHKEMLDELDKLQDEEKHRRAGK